MNRPAGTIKTVDEFNETLEQLELLIGKDNAKKVVDFFEGMNIYFPKRIGLYELHNQIYEELRNGVTYYEAAVKYGYTKSYIRKIEHKITDRNRRDRQAQSAAGVCEPHIRLVAREARDRAEHKFGQGELFYGNGS
jgi:hypothetical protein